MNDEVFKSKFKVYMQATCGANNPNPVTDGYDKTNLSIGSEQAQPLIECAVKTKKQNFNFQIGCV